MNKINLNDEASGDKKHGLKLAVGGSFYDETCSVYQAFEAPNYTRCTGCAFENWKKDKRADKLCRHVVCARGFTKDGKGLIFKRIKVDRQALASAIITGIMKGFEL